MNRTHFRALGVLVLVGLLAACAAPKRPAAGTDGMPTLEEELRAAARLTAELPYQTVRFNPTPEACACPPFEVLVGERWWRARLDGPTPSEGPALPEQLAVLAKAAWERGEVRVYYTVGRLDDDPLVACRNGRYGFEVRVESFSDVPPPLGDGPAAP